jgi:hypothetical protein
MAFKGIATATGLVYGTIHIQILILHANTMPGQRAPHWTRWKNTRGQVE